MRPLTDFPDRRFELCSKGGSAERAVPPKVSDFVGTPNLRHWNHFVGSFRESRRLVDLLIGRWHDEKDRG